MLNKDKLKDIIDRKGMGYIELYEKVVNLYGENSIDITYKGFMSLLSNRSSWKLLYAYVIIDALGVSVNDIFDLIDIDIEKKIKEKEKWKEKYQK